MNTPKPDPIPISTTQIVCYADTPDEIRQQLVQFFRAKAGEAFARAKQPNQSTRAKEQWIIRAGTADGAVRFLTSLLIKPLSEQPVP